MSFVKTVGNCLHGNGLINCSITLKLFNQTVPAPHFHLWFTLKGWQDAGQFPLKSWISPDLVDTRCTEITHKHIAQLPRVGVWGGLGQNNNLQREPNSKEISSFCLLHSQMSQHSSDVLICPQSDGWWRLWENDLVGAVSQHSKDLGLHPNNSRSSQTRKAANRKGILQSNTHGI